MISKLREPVSGLSHFVGVIASLLGWVSLLISAGGRSIQIISGSIYGISLVLLFSASTVYHSVKASEKIINKLRVFDHSAI